MIKLRVKIKHHQMNNNAQVKCNQVSIRIERIKKKDLRSRDLVKKLAHDNLDIKASTNKNNDHKKSEYFAKIAKIKVIACKRKLSSSISIRKKFSMNKTKID